MGKNTVDTQRCGAGELKPMRRKVRYGYRNGKFVWLPSKKAKKAKKAETCEEQGQLTSSDLDHLLELLQSPTPPKKTTAAALAPPPLMTYGDWLDKENRSWVTEENDKAGRVLPSLAQLLGITVRQMEDIKEGMYLGEADLLACGNICLVYAGGLMMRWVRMVPLEAMRIWQDDGGADSVYDNYALSAELLARRWQKLRSLGDKCVATILAISMCVATKQINTPLYNFQLKFCMPSLRRLGCSYPIRVVNAMENRFLRQLKWRTHLRMRSNSPEFPDLGLCEYNHILEALPTLMDGREVAWDRLFSVMGAIK